MPDQSKSARRSDVFTPCLYFVGSSWYCVLQTRASKRKTLVLDLDETLVHSSLEACDAPHFTFPVIFGGRSHEARATPRQLALACSCAAVMPLASVSGPANVDPPYFHIERAIFAVRQAGCGVAEAAAAGVQVGVRRRPDLAVFLERVSQLFEVVVFTASQKVTAPHVSANRMLQPHFGRHCSSLGSEYTPLFVSGSPCCCGILHAMHGFTATVSQPADLCGAAVERAGPGAAPHPAPHLPGQLRLCGGQLSEGPLHAGPGSGRHCHN